jgi:hypothetical protein
MSTDSLADQMSAAAAAVLAGLDDRQRTLAARPFAGDAARRWLEYRPRRRPGACLADLGVPARKAAHRLLATGLSEHAYAQAMTIVALEEVLDRKEPWRRGRHSGDYWVSVYGDPRGGEPWSWRFEGHHLSVTMTVAGDRVSPRAGLPRRQPRLRKLRGPSGLPAAGSGGGPGPGAAGRDGAAGQGGRRGGGPARPRASGT